MKLHAFPPDGELPWFKGLGSGEAVSRGTDRTVGQGVAGPSKVQSPSNRQACSRDTRGASAGIVPVRDFLEELLRLRALDRHVTAVDEPGAAVDRDELPS